MAEYKNQHWLPVSYLKRFAVDPTANRKSAKVWRYRRDGNTTQKVETECCDDYFYSKTDAENTERSFHPMENDYPNLVEKLVLGEALTRIEGHRLTACIVSLFLRNPSLENSSGMERFEAQQSAEGLFLNQMAGLQPQSLDQFGTAITSQWRLSGVFSAGPPFITSDNPVLVYYDSGEWPRLVMVPATPSLLLISARAEQCAVVSTEASPRDVAVINAAVVIQSMWAVYSDHELPAEDRRVADRYLSQLEEGKPRGRINSDGLSLAPAPAFSTLPTFLKCQ